MQSRDLQLQLEALHDVYLESQQFLRQSQQFLQTSQAEKENLQAQTEALQRRVKDAEHRAEVAERRAHDARQGAIEGEPSWVVQRDEIHLTDTELGRGGWAVVRVAEFREVRCAAKCFYRQIVSNYNRVLFTH